MKDPSKWFEEGINSGDHEKEVIAGIKSCISKNGFNVDKFMDWVLKQLEKDLGED